jgi:hypothetical protein
MATYLDEAGNPIASAQQPAAKTYLDDNGNPKAPPSPVSNGLSHVGARLAEAPGQMWNAVRHPLDTVTGMYGQQKNLAKEGLAAARQGDVPLAVARGLETVMPGIGPSIASGFKLMRAGDVSGGTGDIVGNLLPSVGLPLAARGAGSLMRGVAPGLAEKAMGITARDRKYGLNNGEIGRAILTDTKGVRPETVAESAKNRVGQLGRQVEGAAQGATRSGVSVPLQTARAAVSNTQNLMRSGNAGKVAESLGPQAAFLTNPEDGFRGQTEYPQAAHTPLTLARTQSTVLGPNGQPLPGPVGITRGLTPAKVISPTQNPSDFLNMRRRFNDQFGPGSWGSDTPDTTTSAFRNTYGALTNALQKAVPETAAADAKIHALLPVARSAEAVSRREGIGPRVMTRIERPTGGLIPAIAGYAAGGAPMAALGAAVPELLSSPSPRLLMGRGLMKAGSGLRSTPVSIAAGALPLARKTDDQR